MMMGYNNNIYLIKKFVNFFFLSGCKPNFESFLIKKKYSTTKSFVKNKYKNKNIKTFHKRFSSLYNTSKDADV